MEQREDNKNDIASRRLKNPFGEALVTCLLLKRRKPLGRHLPLADGRKESELWYSALQQLLPWHYFCFGAFLRKTFYPKKSKCLLL